MASDLGLPANRVIAGCNFADLMMRIVMLPILDGVMGAWPRGEAKGKVTLSAVGVVDDIQLHVVGPLQLAVSTLVGAFGSLARGLCKAQLPLKKKLAATGTSAKFLAAVSGASPLLKGAGASTTRNLGHDYGDGRQAGSTVRSARLRKVRKLLPKLQRLRRAGANTRRLTLGAVKFALVYGFSSSCPPRGFVMAAGSAAHAAIYQTPRGRAVTIGLALAGGPADPRPTLLANPLVGLAAACWETWIPRHQIWLAWATASKQAAVQMIGSKFLSGKAAFTGPIAAGLAAARRIGWEPAGPGKLLTKRNVEVDLCATSPATIRTLAERDGLDLLLENEVDRQTFLWELGGVPFLDESRALLGGKSRRSGAYMFGVLP